jgi:hypothetical protein
MATRRSQPARLLAAGATAGLVIAVASTGVGGSPSWADRLRAATDRPWSGFRIEAGDGASGSWIGARKLGHSPGRVVYRIDPTAQRQPDGYGARHRATSVTGPGPKRAAGVRATARAAWILSKYGSYRYEIQSAAVDAAVLHLLAGRQHALNKRVGEKRLRQTGQAPQIRRFATIMLRDSAGRSGPYQVAARQVGESAIGDAVRVGVQVVVARSGGPLPSVPVSVRVGSGAWRPAGETDESGRTTFAYVGTLAGPQPVTARVARVPEHRLLLMWPRRPAASRVAVAGRKHVLSAPTTAVVKARPEAAVTARSIDSGRRTRGSLQITDAYGSTASRATVVLRGPFGSPGQVTCQRKALRLRHVPVAGTGRYRLPRLEVRQTGYYIWHVVAPGNAFNLEAAACDGAFRVRPRR